MKTYFIFSCLLISGGLVSATTQTTVNQDKPTRLYLKSYTDVHNENGVAAFHFIYVFNDFLWATNISTDTYTYSENLNYQDGVAGSFSQNSYYLDDGYQPFVYGMDNDTATFYWPQSLWPYVYENEIEIDVDTEVSENGWGGNYSTSTSTNRNCFYMEQEHCSMNMSATYPICGSGPWPCTAGSTTVSRSAQAIMKLQSGGKSPSKLRNLFGISGGAAQNQYTLNEWTGGYCVSQGWNVTNTIPVPSQNITIGSYGALNANGVMYKILPDNADVDVTPRVAGVDYYTFNVSATKYHSYFDLFVQQANPGYSFYPVGTGTNVGYYAGHVFWCLRTEAPSEALQYISPALIAYWGTNGFEPGTNNHACSSDPGQLLDNNGHSANINRTFGIGFDKLIDGLIYVRGIHDAPPAYCFSGINCTAIAVFTGEHAGVHWLPGDQSPQNFGVTLIEMYPAPGQIIGPFEDNTDVFYSPY